MERGNRFFCAKNGLKSPKNNGFRHFNSVESSISRPHENDVLHTPFEGPLNTL